MLLAGLAPVFWTRDLQCRESDWKVTGKDGPLKWGAGRDAFCKHAKYGVWVLHCFLQWPLFM